MKDKEKNNIFIFGAKTTGPSHIKSGLPCQDAWHFEIFDDDSAVLAVSDGLGSAVHSKTGAKTAVFAAVESVGRHFLVSYDKNCRSADLTKNDAIVKEAFSSAVKSIQDYSKKNEIPARELACTLIVVFIYKGFVTTGQIGDGAVVGQFFSGDIKMLSKPQDSEYINEVTPITAENAAYRLIVNANIKNVKNIAAFTDGCQRAVLVKENGIHSPFMPFFKPLFSYSQSAKDSDEASEDVKNLLLSKKINEVSDDDKTLVIAALRKEIARDS